CIQRRSAWLIAPMKRPLDAIRATLKLATVAIRVTSCYHASERGPSIASADRGTTKSAARVRGRAFHRRDAAGVWIDRRHGLRTRTSGLRRAGGRWLFEPQLRRNNVVLVCPKARRPVRRPPERLHRPLPGRRRGAVRGGHLRQDL